MTNTIKEIAELGHIKLQVFIDAGAWTYSDPQATAERSLSSHEKHLFNEVSTILNFAKEADADIEIAKKLAKEYMTGYKKRYEKQLYAESRCASSFITGGSNFPVRQMEKRNDIARRRSEELLSYCEWKMKKVKNTLQPTIIKSTDDNAIAQLQAKVDALIDNQDMMKIGNKTIKKYKKANETINETELAQLLKDAGITSDMIKEAFTDFGGLGFPSFMLTNNNAKIKNTSRRLIKLIDDEQKAKKIEAGEVEAKEHIFKDGKVIYNYEAQRVQVLFDNIPCESMRKILKSNGCRWSPKNSAWQMHLKEWNFLKIKNALTAYYKDIKEVA